MSFRDSPARPSIREQIAAKRAEARNSPAGKRLAAAQAAAADPSATGYGSPLASRRTQAMTYASPEKLPEKSLEGEIRRAAMSGKLDLCAMSLEAVPSQVYTTLLGIPAEELSSPPSTDNAQPDDLPKAQTFDPFKPIAKGLSKDDERAQVFGAKAVKKDDRWVEPEELSSFRMADNKLVQLEREIGMFGGLERLDLSRNMLKTLPDSVGDLLRLTTLDLSGNAFTSLPRQVLVLPLLQVLDISGNALTSLTFDSPVGPSEDGLSYGIGFFTTSFQRQAELKAVKPVFPALRSWNLGHNKLTVAGLAEMAKVDLKAMRVLNIESNNLQGALDLISIGVAEQSMPILASLILSRNSNLRSVTGLDSVTPGAKVEILGCNIRDATPGPSTPVKGINAGTAPAPTDDDTSADPSLASSTPGKPIPNPDHTFVFRTLPAATFDSEPLAVDFDLYLPTAPSSSGSKGHPLVIWFHGGGLLQGNKENLPPHFRRLPSLSLPSSGGCTEESIAVISPNYRLAPQTPILEILDDIDHLLTYVRTKLNDRLVKEGKKEHVIDTDRICLSGGSAGGYLALVAGLPVPKEASEEDVGGYRGLKDKTGIKCVAPFYPITDLTDKFWATETDPVPWRGTSVPHVEAKPHLHTKAAPICTAVSGGPRSILYPYMLQHGLFPGLLFQTQKSIGYGLDAFRPSPVSLSIPHRLDLLAKAKTRAAQEHVPVYFVYGTIDDKVQPMEKTLAAFEHGDAAENFVAERVEGGDHAYDEDPEVECEAFREWLGKTLL
ncbi:hypothetical protein IAU60_002759 [Kwoniella sp. DSM 27419]